MKNDFNSFKVGTIFNPLKAGLVNVRPILNEITVLFPKRLNAMSIDPSKITENNNMTYTAGEIMFSIKLYTKIHIKLDNSGKCTVSDNSQKKQVILHVFELMKSAIGFKEGMFFEIEDKENVNHGGLGSTGSLVGGIGAAINEIFENPIPRDKLLKYLAQNYGEEIVGCEKELSPVQCIGGSIATGLYDGGLMVITGENRVIKTAKIDDCYEAVLGIPRSFKEVSSEEALNRERHNFKNFLECGKKFGPEIAYNVLHKLLPAMDERDMKTVGDVIYDYRFNKGSIKNCSFIYPEIIDLTKSLSFLKTQGKVDVLSISSVGPTIFAITKEPEKCMGIFESHDLKVFRVRIENHAYSVIK